MPLSLSLGWGLSFEVMFASVISLVSEIFQFKIESFKVQET